MDTIEELQKQHDAARNEHLFHTSKALLLAKKMEDLEFRIEILKQRDAALFYYMPEAQQ